MCKRPATSCFELGDDPEMWSKRSPLVPKDWFDDCMKAFDQAYRAAVAGEQQTALEWLAQTRDREVNQWFDVHAQNTGTFRSAKFGLEPMPDPMPTLDSLRQVTKFETDLFERDGYRCRYCAVRVVPGNVTKRMETLLGKEVFDATSRSNAARHGIKLAFSAALDHVDPHSRGGKTKPENLVTSCWACNYGKANYTLTELGLDDPRDIQPIVDGWIGLTDVGHPSVTSSRGSLVTKVTL